MGRDFSTVCNALLDTQELYILELRCSIVFRTLWIWWDILQIQGIKIALDSLPLSFLCPSSQNINFTFIIKNYFKFLAFINNDLFSFFLILELPCMCVCVCKYIYNFNLSRAEKLNGQWRRTLDENGFIHEW